MTQEPSSTAAPAASPAPAASRPGATPVADAVVELRDVGKSFEAHGKRATTVEALRGIDLTIGRGEFVSLIGPSGCGKSTLLRIIADLTTATTGTVTVNAKPASQARLDHDYGMVFQAPVLFDWRTVRRNVELPLEIIGRDKATREAKAREMLELVELGEFGDHHPWQLSGGMQQRAAIARALALDPSLILMDEPFGALDEMTRERMNLELLRIWARTGTTIVFVTHSIPEAVFLSTRVVVMSARPGRITKVIPIDLPTHARCRDPRDGAVLRARDGGPRSVARDRGRERRRRHPPRRGRGTLGVSHRR